MHGASSKVITKKTLQELVDKGLTAKEIYETLNISDSVFYHLLKRLGINYNRSTTGTITKIR